MSDMTEEDALTIATHRHYKGGLYRVYYEATHSETQETVVVYAHLWPHEYKIWVRPKRIWDEPTADGRVRFEPLPKREIKFSKSEAMREASRQIREERKRMKDD